MAAKVDSLGGRGRLGCGCPAPSRRGCPEDERGRGGPAQRGCWRAALLAVALPLGLLFVRHLLLVRPVILTLVFCAAFVLVLERFAAGRAAARAALGLPALTVVWANCQGLWPLGPLDPRRATCGGEGLARLAAAARAAGGRRPAAARRAGALPAAGFITPYGWRGVALPVKLLLRLVPANANVFSSQVAENVPPWLLARGDAARSCCRC